ncbi:MAG: ABC transporter permease [Planctomycetaceae bacterium]|nr:ABC transporter permease [Planctomycetaceae bacterium]
MENIIAIAWKDLLLLSRDRMAMFFLLAFPVLMGVLFGLMYQNTGSPKPGGLAVGVVDEDQSTMSETFIKNLVANEVLKVETMDMESAKEKIRKGVIAGIVVLPPGFGDSAGVFWATNQVPIRVGRDPSRAAEAAMLDGFLMEASGKLIAERFRDTNYIRGVIADQKQALEADSTMNPLNKLVLGQLFSSMDGLFDNLDKVSEIENAEGGVGNPVMNDGFQFAKIESFDAFERPTKTGPAIRSGWDISFPQSILWGVMGSAAGFAISLVRERSRGTLLRLQTSPVRSWQVILGKGLGCFIATMAVLVVMVALGLFLGMRPQSPALLACSSIVVALCFVGIMMAMSALGTTEEGVGGAGWAINMVMAMFGGAMMPLAFMPGFMKVASDFSPVKWAIVSLEAAIWRGYSLQEMLWPWSILLIIGSVGFAMGLYFFERNQSK